MSKATKKTVKPKKPITPAPEPRMHSWRPCPFGYHHVNEHMVHCQPSNKNPNGLVVKRSEHCAKNPGGKDILRAKEIECISDTHFKNLKNLPSKGTFLGFGKKADLYDDLIAGWVQYWNEVFEPATPLTPNFVKALIASESSFTINPDGSAIGLMQLLPKTHKYLSGTKDEVKKHLIVVTKQELLSPSVNICAGVRWLFRKREMVLTRLKREVSWLEVLADYKGLNEDGVTEQRKKELEGTFYEHYKNIERKK